ncbi:MAG: ferredoxin III, nif-specific [Thiocapsa sp.]|jgi:Nif-specific ferredoxin III|nr:ferredoxin III, nif-specific [Thiocapsa sp.]MCG6896889.1 ferredoxin III, nif-specific [Thiocapsa sp.]MCG6985513.1 ferredoxin III, nif-specific [Thiocapsa sp.]
MSVITGITRGGGEWTPAFVIDINQNHCIGCGRCYKVCPRDVFELVDRDDLDLDALEDEGDDDDFDEAPGMVMNLKDALDCIGCQACSRVCPKKCLSHQPLAAAA